MGVQKDDSKQSLWSAVDGRAGFYSGLSDRIWAMPELAYSERRSVAELKVALEREGFRIQENFAGMPTALLGEVGEGGPVIAFLGEFDALPGLAQEAGVSERRPVEGHNAGHACGHNLLGAGALLAAAALKDWLAASGRPGRIRFYGCPAEEGGAGKTFMVRDGAFADVDAAITWHPAHLPGVFEPISLANTRIDFAFTGRAAHAAASPHLGRSALDACELMNVGVNYMREHMPMDARVHYAYLDAGGIAPNVVQAFAKVRYLIRAADLPELNRLVERVRKIGEGAALMTECKLELSFTSAVSNLLANPPLEKALHDNMLKLGPPQFDAEDHATAKRFQAALSPQDIEAVWRRTGIPMQADKALGDFIVPLEARGLPSVGSTDVGDVSWVVPTVQARGAGFAIGTTFHTWQVTGQSSLPAAHKGMVHAAKTMAATGMDLLTDPKLLEQAKADHRARVAVTPYVCPIPVGVQPPFEMSKV